MHAGSKAFFYALSRSAALKRLASKYGMATHESFARRFIAGETIEEAVECARTLQSEGMLLTLDYLGESVATTEDADAARAEYLRLIDVIAASGIERNISLKLTQLGLDVDHATCVDNFRRILDPAERHTFFIRIDMEGSRYTHATLDIFETLWRHGHRDVGVVLQSCLRRSESDLLRMLELGARVRLVKGAYYEPKTIAYQRKTDVDEAFLRITRQLLDSGNYPAIATHDPRMIDATIAHANDHSISSDRFEFQMLYGVRRDLQASLLARGYQVRVYLPCGHLWFPYYMRRLGERPANVIFVLRSLLHER